MAETEALSLPYPLPPANPDLFGLKSDWPPPFGSSAIGAPGRVEGEMNDLIVHGEIPKAIDGTFYRIMIDPFYPLAPGNPPVEGDGNISAFRIKAGHVDMKMKYVDTERLKLERQAQKRLFGLYRNPFTHHPCVRAAVDSTANTNLVLWGGHLLALKEGALPYAVDPYTLETRNYDPFRSPGKTFSAHPKVDPYSDELVAYGYEAKGLGSRDIVVYSLDKNGKIHDEQWVQSPWCAPIHDCAITPNFIVLFLWPYEANVEHMKAGGQHWEWTDEHPATFLVIPRRKDKVPKGWSPGEFRSYQWRQNSFLIHSASAWEDASGKVFLETSRVSGNLFPMWPRFGQPLDFTSTVADFVCWELDTAKPSGSVIPDPTVVLDIPAEFPRIDERLLTQKYKIIFLPVAIRDKTPNGLPMPLSLNALAKVDKKAGTTEYFLPGEKCVVEEPIFVPRSDDSPEGDGWVIVMVQRVEARKSDLVVLDSRSIEKPVAIIQMPFAVRGQIHGNWVDTKKQLPGHKQLATL
ncbi:lignostilbene dioxygenase [Cadophora sp. MPI-SDFR-AT-0126]|nr:lignostilbene dioxygenase [Leotiomycetes sp. MPI-SDFR-AT-0126]